MKCFPVLLALAFGLAHGDDLRTCEVSGWLKMRPVANADGDEYGDPDWAEKILLYRGAQGEETAATLPEPFLGEKWDYLDVIIDGRAENGRFPVHVAAYGAQRDSTLTAQQGWLRGEDIGFALQSSQLHAQANSESPVLLQLQEGDWLTERGDFTLRDCQGQWVFIDYRQQSRRTEKDGEEAIPAQEQQTLSGWARGVCPILETTCDMQ